MPGDLLGKHLPGLKIRALFVDGIEMTDHLLVCAPGPECRPCARTPSTGGGVGGASPCQYHGGSPWFEPYSLLGGWRILR